MLSSRGGLGGKQIFNPKKGDVKIQNAAKTRLIIGFKEYVENKHFIEYFSRCWTVDVFLKIRLEIFCKRFVKLSGSALIFACL